MSLCIDRVTHDLLLSDNSNKNESVVDAVLKLRENSS